MAPNAPAPMSWVVVATAGSVFASSMDLLSGADAPPYDADRRQPSEMGQNAHPGAPEEHRRPDESPRDQTKPCECGGQGQSSQDDRWPKPSLPASGSTQEDG